MPAASEINACCPTSLTLLKQPEDSADGFNGLLLFMFITAQICHVNTNFLNSDSAVIQLPPSKHVQYFVCLRLFWKWSEKRSAGGDFNRLLLILVRSNLSRCRADRHTNTQCILYGLLFPVLMSPGSVSLVQERQRTLVWVKGQPSDILHWLLKSRISEEVPVLLTPFTYFRCIGGTGGRRTDVIIEFWLFSLVFPVFFHQQTGNEGCILI